MEIKGIDISRAQTDIDFDEIVKAGIKFVIIRAGIGTDEDTFFRKYLAECEKRNIDYGFYWFFEATTEAEMKKECEACISVLKGKRPSYPVFVDMESQTQIDKMTTDQRTDMALYICQMLEKNGLPAGIYANPSWMENYYDKSRIMGKYDIWLANWTYDPKIESKYDYLQTMWQWGLTQIDGRDVDADICYIDYPNKTKMWYSVNNIPTDAETSVDAPETTQDAPESVSAIKVGDKVTVKKNARFSNGVIPCVFVYNTVFDVVQMSRNGEEALLSIGGSYTGWMYTKDLVLVESKAEEKPAQSRLSVGDTVKVTNGATTYDGRALAAFVYIQLYTVMEVSGDRIVIGQNGNVTAAVNEKDLIKI